MVPLLVVGLVILGFGAATAFPAPPRSANVNSAASIGVEKLDLMPKLFTPEDLAMMIRLREAFNPTNLCSPNKMLPTAGACAEPSKLERTKPGRRAAL